MTNPNIALINMSTVQVPSVINPLADDGFTVPGKVPFTVILLQPVIVPSEVLSSTAVTEETVYPPIFRFYIVSVAVVPLSATVTWALSSDVETPLEAFTVNVPV